jgi:hypothetical protein
MTTTLHPRTPSIEVRPSDRDEAKLIRRLAALDDAPELDGQVLLGLVDGDPVAAVSLSDGRVVADPFVGTGEVVTLLRVRAKHLSGVPARRRVPRRPRLRVA